MLTWLLIIIILVLFAVIIIRDKRIREALINLFLRLKKKIRVARIKAKINKENEKMAELVRNLGEETWRKRVDVSFVFEEKNKVDNLVQEKKGIEAEIERLNAEIEKNKKTFEEFSKNRESLIKEQEDKRDPLAKELSRVKKELHDWEKETNEREKLKVKIEKKLTANRQKIEEVEKDEDLSKIEKKDKREEIENTIKELESSREKVLRELEPFKREKPDKEKRPGEIEPKVRSFDEKIKALKEEKKSEEKRVDEIIAGLRKNRNNLVAKQSQLKKELDSLFGRIGEKVNKNRVESSDLSPLYTQIDNLNKTIKELQKQVIKAQQSTGNEQ